MAQTPCLSLVSSAYRGLSVIFLKPDLKHRFLFTSPTRYLLRYFFIIQSVSKYPVWLQIFQHIFSLLLLHNSWKLPMLLFLKKSSSLIKHSQDISTNLAWSSTRPTPPPQQHSHSCWLKRKQNVKDFSPRWRTWLAFLSLDLLNTARSLNENQPWSSRGLSY